MRRSRRGVEGAATRRSVRELKEQKRNELALPSSAEIFAVAFYASPVEMALTTLPEDRFIEVNEKFAGQAGFTREELLGRTFVEMGIWTSPAERMRVLEEMKSGGVIENFEIAARGKGGESRLKLSSMQPITITGQPCLLTVCQDVTGRKKFQAALWQSEERFARAFRYSPNAVAITALADGRFIDVNEAFERGSGYARSEIIGHTATELGFWPAAPDREQVLAALKKSGSLKNQEIQFRTKTGETVVLLTSMIIMDLDHQKCLLTIGHDVTGRKSAEEALRLSDERFRLMADNIAEVFWILDPATLNPVYVSAGFEKIFGRTLESLRTNSHSHRQLIHPDDVARIEAGLERLRVTGELTEQFRVTPPDGPMKWVEARGSMAKDTGGRVSALVGTAQDITARKKVEQDLRASEAEYRSLFFEAPYGICRVNANGAFLIFNRAFMEILGYPLAEELRAKNLDMDIYADPEEKIRMLKHLEVSDRISDVELSWKRKSGKTILVRASIRCIRDEQGQTEYLEIMVEDITQHKEFQEHFRRMQKMEALAMLAGGIAHDFNNILAGILGYGELLLNSMDPEDSRYSRLQSVVNAALQGRNLTAKLLAFTRDEGLATYPVNVDQEILQMEDMLTRIIEENIELTFELQQPHGKVLLSSGLLYQMILNLAINARDAMPDGGKLSISTARVKVPHVGTQPAGIPKGQYLVLQVSDTGYGMSKEVQERIFEPFFTTKIAGKGTGFGLFTVFTIVRQCSGHLRIRSKPGEGSTFEIYLPMVEPSPSEVLRDDSQNLPKASGNLIMVIEDNARVRNALCDQLKALGYLVLSEEKSLQAISDFETCTEIIDLVITDVVMPDLNGPDLVQSLRGLKRDLKVLYITGYAEQSVFSMEALGPGTDLLYKPFTLRDLSVKLQTLLTLRAECDLKS